MPDSQYETLLIAIGLSAVGLAVALFGSWLSRRGELFMLTWAVGVVLLGASVLAFRLNAEAPSPIGYFLAHAVLLLSVSIIFGAARQFHAGGPVLGRIGMTYLLGMLVLAPAFAVGLDGLGYMLGNLLVGVLFTATAYEYWTARNEAPLPLIGLGALYSLSAVSFVLCALVLAFDGQWVLTRVPDNWAEDLNLYVGLIGVTGAGALSLALHQARLARQHRTEAMTDELTGLLNRRALFQRFDAAPPLGAALVLIDLDHFKAINDTHGHEAGDMVLRTFADLVRRLGRPQDSAARIGGEEFVLVMPDCPAEKARDAAERLRVAFAAAMAEHGSARIAATASAGIAVVDGRGFNAAISAADAALYRAKDQGRDRVVMAPPRLAA